MSSREATLPAAVVAAAHPSHLPAEDGHGPDAEGRHETRLAHHFESPAQQFQAGKLGMWLFLVTEVLFFGGLFVAYAVYRRNHPEVFVDAHHYLNTTLGMVNTLVLLFSSLTMAWAVRCAQLSHKKGLVVCVAATFACASLFLGIKSVEYSHKWEKGLLWAGAYRTTDAASEHGAQWPLGLSRQLAILCLPAAVCGLACAAGWCRARQHRRARASRFWWSMLVACAAFFVGCGFALLVESRHAAHQLASDKRLEMQAGRSADLDAAQPPLVTRRLYADGSTAERLPVRGSAGWTGVFFSIYYAMTGVHAIHILAGMGALGWILQRALQGEFHAGYFAPVDFVGLYWHLVDLVWIFLFPLLYLIR